MVRLATDAYMVIMAPMMAPMEKMVLSEMPRMLKNLAMTSDCSA